MLSSILSTQLKQRSASMVTSPFTKFVKKKFTDVPKKDVTMFGSKKTTIRWLLDFEKDKMPNFALRRFEIQPGGSIGLHSHPQEHEIYVISGESCVITNGEDQKVVAKGGDVLYVPSNEPHDYYNNGTDTFTFLCLLLNVFKVLERCPQDNETIALSFNNIPLGDLNAKRIIQVLSANPLITKLSLRNTKITKQSAEQLSEFLKTKHSLQEVDLSQNRIGISGVRTICDAISLRPIITGLYLNDCKIGNDGAIVLSDLLETCLTLENLEICKNKVGKRGMSFIVEALRENYSLVSLRVEKNSGILKEDFNQARRYVERNSAVSEVLDQIISNTCHPSYKYRMHNFSKSVRGIDMLLGKKQQMMESQKDNSRLVQIFEETGKRAKKDNIVDSKVEKGKWRVGFAEMMGRRETQEDVLVIKENWFDFTTIDSIWAINSGFWDHNSIKKRVKGKYEEQEEEEEKIFQETIVKGELRNIEIENSDFFGLFDGHGGREASEHVGNILPLKIKEKINNGMKIEKAIHDSFVELHHEMLHWCLYSGTTAVLIIILGNFVWVVNLGDSNAVLCRNGYAVGLTTPQKPNDKEEKKRIEESGGYVKDGRVNGMLAVSRAFGDGYLKNVISAEPQINNFQLSSADSFIILACDGVWDVLSEEKAVEIVSGEIDPQKAAKRLRDEAYSQGSTDNISVIIIFLD
ncbi:phosphatase 2c [Anaeramoeba flamelloides]|uniref:Phosphatase 2c n=1 Tax=Anaeramoeba flamelloides TaxID=1746091 RepID=A0AAV7ZYE9_9EUKA|nr:phosphatase 2c [Anaeramoeba flamelloides]